MAVCTAVEIRMNVEGFLAPNIPTFRIPGATIIISIFNLEFYNRQLGGHSMEIASSVDY